MKVGDAIGDGVIVEGNADASIPSVLNNMEDACCVSPSAFSVWVGMPSGGMVTSTTAASVSRAVTFAVAVISAQPAVHSSNAIRIIEIVRFIAVGVRG